MPIKTCSNVQIMVVGMWANYPTVIKTVIIIAATPTIRHLKIIIKFSKKQYSYNTLTDSKAGTLCANKGIIRLSTYSLFSIF